VEVPNAEKQSARERISKCDFPRWNEFTIGWSCFGAFKELSEKYLDAEKMYCKNYPA
jgi:hypothetical protein